MSRITVLVVACGLASCITAEVPVPPNGYFRCTSADECPETAPLCENSRCYRTELTCYPFGGGEDDACLNPDAACYIFPDGLGCVPFGPVRAGGDCGDRDCDRGLVQAGAGDECRCVLPCHEDEDCAVIPGSTCSLVFEDDPRHPELLDFVTFCSL